jgi:hypothetical protein
MAAGVGRARGGVSSASATSSSSDEATFVFLRGSSSSESRPRLRVSSSSLELIARLFWSEVASVASLLWSCQKNCDARRCDALRVPINNVYNYFSFAQGRSFFNRATSAAQGARYLRA